MSFGHPWLLLTLLVVPLAVVAYRLAERRRMKYAVRFTNLDLLAGVVGGRAWRHLVAPAVFLLALATLCVGVARPHVRTLVPKDRATVILVVDVSRSMEARDVKPSRLKAAEAAVRTFLDHAPKRVRIGLIAFAGTPEVAAPPTTDHELVRSSLDVLDSFPGFGGTAIGDALAAAVELGQRSVGPTSGDLAVATAAPRSGDTRGLVSILFLSDGAQTRGDLEPLQGAERAKAAGIPVYTVALGTPNGILRFNGGFGPGGGGGGGGSGGGGFPFGRTVRVPPDPETLRGIANVTGGRFFAARSSDALQSAYTKLGSELGRTPGRTEVTYAFVVGAAGLLLLAGLLSAAWAPRLP